MGASVSEPIDFNQQPHLVEFFRRYFKVSRKLCGVDTTVGVPTADEAFAVRNCLQLNKDVILAKIAVPSPTSKRQYVIRALKGEPYTPPGCATHGFEAYNIERGRKVFVQDTWRVDLPGIEKEGETYKLLWDAQVRNIAVCSATGDIYDHATRTHHYQDRPWACKTRSSLVLHCHYRLVLDTVGQLLTNFPSTHIMLCSILDAVHSTHFYVLGQLITHFEHC
jgi:hypothetical protein